MSNSVEDSGNELADTTDTLVGPNQSETFPDPRDADLLNKSRAEVAYEQKGLAGTVEISQDILQDVVDDLSALAERDNVRSSDVQFHVSALRELIEILSTAAQKESKSDSADEASITPEDLGSSHEEETEEAVSDEINDINTKGEEQVIGQERFVEATIDRISGSGNILATSSDIPVEHIHVSHGTIGNQVIVLRPSRGWQQVKSGKERACVLPGGSVEDAVKNFSVDKKPQLKVGDHLKIDVEEVDGEKGIATLSKFQNVDRVIAFGKPSKEGDQLTIEIKEINEDTAQGYVTKRIRKEKTRKRRTQKRKKYKNRSSRKGRRKGHGLKKSQIPGGNNRNKNDLLNGKL